MASLGQKNTSTMPAGLQTGQSCSNILTHQRWREPSEQETSTPSFLFPGLWQAHAVANYSNRSPQVSAVCTLTLCERRRKQAVSLSECLCL
mmetsp:Transcript_15257/g.45713  ORF Transcript_15257/g.45713 Transcript_15257/m.45713 type:complete len:91 (-) Transcript_15257:14-286(-)